MVGEEIIHLWWGGEVFSALCFSARVGCFMVG